MSHNSPVWAMLLAASIALVLWADRKPKERFVATGQVLAPPTDGQVIQAVPHIESLVSQETRLENDLAVVIDRDVPDGSRAVGLKTVTVNATDAQQRVDELLERVNSFTKYNFMRVEITNAKLQVDAVADRYLSVLFMAHDAKKFFSRQIGANMTIINNVMYVQSVGFINSNTDTSDIVGVLDVASQQTYQAFPDPFSDEW